MVEWYRLCSQTRAKVHESVLTVMCSHLMSGSRLH